MTRAPSQPRSGSTSDENRGLRMRARIAAIAASMAALAASTPIVAAPAQAADGWSVSITTTKAIAYADSRFRSDGHWVWFRPRFTVRTTVVCPVGETAVL